MLAAIGYSVRLLPPDASSGAAAVDGIFYALFWMTVVLCTLIFGTIIIFSIRYRRGASTDRHFTGKFHNAIELTWTIIPAVVGLGFFIWASKVYVMQNRIPRDALEVYVVAKQWMWKLQHAEGPREINELHVPVGKPVKLLMQSQDVIHSFFVPEFRTKRDVLPGRFEAMWFQATKPGEYHLFCAEYCGTEHSRMKGKIVAMAPTEYSAWIKRSSTPENPAVAGAHLFRQLACNNCHGPVDTERGPALFGIYGKRVRLTDGGLAEVDEDYLAHAISEPSRQIVSGYKATMPLYQGQVDPEKMVALVAYIKSLGQQARAGTEIRVREGEQGIAAVTEKAK